MAMRSLRRTVLVGARSSSPIEQATRLSTGGVITHPCFVPSFEEHRAHRKAVFPLANDDQAALFIVRR